MIPCKLCGAAPKMRIGWADFGRITSGIGIECPSACYGESVRFTNKENPNDASAIIEVVKALERWWEDHKPTTDEIVEYHIKNTPITPPETPAT